MIPATALSTAEAASISVEEPAGRPIPTNPGILLYQAEAAYLLGLSPRTLEAYRLRGGGPLFVRAGRVVRYRRADLDRWIEARLSDSTRSVSNR